MEKDKIRDSTILITGGTGSLGQELIKQCLPQAKAIRILSNDECSLVDTERKFNNPKLRFLLGDIRDSNRLRRAMFGVDYAIHCASIKHVPICEYSPIEAVRTNIDGSINVINSAIDNKVEKVIAISSDKAVHPINIYGATKLVMEKLFINANTYGETRLSCIRFPNFWGSRGSVIPLIYQQAEKGEITLTHKDMARFWIGIEDAGKFVLDCLDWMNGGEIFIPKVEEQKVIDIIKEIAPEAKVRIIGKRRGEKLHELLFAEGEKPIDKKSYFVVK